MKRLLLLAILLPLNLWAGGDIYVAPTTATPAGNDANAGTEVAPLATIAHALEHITDSNGGWNIILRSGTYSEHDINVAASKTGVDAGSDNVYDSTWNSLRSYPGEWAKINGQESNTNNVGAVIRNSGNLSSTDVASDVARAWIFERIEITGGGSGVHGNVATACGIWWSFGPFTIRYCYIHDNLAYTDDENPSGIGGQPWQWATIEYNYVVGNGSETDHDGNDRQLMTQTAEQCYYEYPPNNATTGIAIAVRDNIVRYNMIDATGQSIGIGMKASNRLTPRLENDGNPIRDITDTTYRANGDKIHHNIVTGATRSGILWQSDWPQIYNNIVDMGGGTGAFGAIETARASGQSGVDTIYPVVYNNTIIGAYAGLFNDMDGKYFQTFQMFAVNNILDSQGQGYDYDEFPFTLYHVYVDNDEWYAARTWPTDFNISSVKVDRNYIYRSGATAGNDFLFGKGLYATGYDHDLSVAQFNSAYSVTNYISATAGMYIGTTGADRYTLSSSWGDYSTVSSGGMGGNHPYLGSTSIPSYMGAVNPTSDDWVAGVLGLATDGNSDGIPDNLLSATAGSTPSWVEGSTPTPAPPTLSNVTISNGRVQ